MDVLIHRLINHEVFPKGGQLSYFITLSIFPFIIAMLNILNFTPLVEPSFLQKILTFLPDSTGNILKTFIQQISLKSSTSLLSLSLITGLWSASSGVRQLIRAINRAYDVPDQRSFLSLALMGLTFTLGLIFMIFLLLASNVLGSKAIHDLAEVLNLNTRSVHILSRGLKITGPIYALAYLFLLYSFSPSIPYKELHWRTVLPGALFSLLGVFFGTLFFTFYTSNFGNYSVTYGSLTGIILFFLWVYLLSVMLLIGGEINAVLYTKAQSNLHWPREDSLLKAVMKENQ